MFFDMHTHSLYSYDADKYTILELCKSAIDKGISVLAITDHMEFFRKSSDPNPPDLFSRQKDIEFCRRKYVDKLEILSGIEIGQPFADPENAKKYLSNFLFDFIGQ